MSFREPNGAVMTANMKPQGGRSIEALSLRGLQGRSAAGQNGQAAKEEMSAIWRGAGCRKNISGVPAGRSVFYLTSLLRHFDESPTTPSSRCASLAPPDGS